MRKAILLTLTLFLASTLAQDGAVSKVPGGIDNRTPGAGKDDKKEPSKDINVLNS
jgi:hypothetical protein